MDLEEDEPARLTLVAELTLGSSTDDPQSPLSCRCGPDHDVSDLQHAQKWRWSLGRTPPEHGHLLVTDRAGWEKHWPGRVAGWTQ